MFDFILKRFSGRQYRRYIRDVTPTVARINQLEKEYARLDDDGLRAKTQEFRERYARRFAEAKAANARLPEEKLGAALRDANQAILKEILPEAFAAAKNACRRLCGRKVLVCGHELTWDMVYFDVQLIGGIALNDNKIAEMATGEGKTLVATLPLYLNSITGRNSQLVTVNDYLARRDSEWMGHLFSMLGVSVGCIQNGQDPSTRRDMYGCDVTYGTASEFGFDYLRDNGMATSADAQVQRDHYYCIIDEVDSILVDEARVPLIISGPAPVERELPFVEMRDTVEALFRQQTAFCNRLVTEAVREFEASPDELPRDSEALTKLLMVKMGAPKNKQFMRLMQDGRVRNLFEKFDLEMGADYNKDKFYDLKERLFFAIDERGHTADLTERGRQFLKPNNPDAFVLPDLPIEYNEIDADKSLDFDSREKAKAAVNDEFIAKSGEIHCISQLLRAYSLYERDVQYVVEEGKVAIIDENTGRKMAGRRWSEGLHAAVEAKERVEIEPETKTYATITLQNYFRMYEKLAGMTGTAETEVQEFRDIYKLDVIVIPTNRPIARKDEQDIIYKTRRDKFNAVIDEIREAHGRGQPVLVGTESVESSEVLSRLLKLQKIPHNVLNAKYHEREAEIVAEAGQKGAVTIATNMAGRGTDIKLGEGVKELGGLYVVGTERHTSRRIDRQLRGRSGRQGDPGRSRFYISLEDDLLRLFANNGAIGALLQRSVGEGAVPLPVWVIENAQKRVEESRYAMRRQLLQYDDVLNRQRQVIYAVRNDAIHVEEPRTVVFDLVREELEARVEAAGLFEGGQRDPDAIQIFLRWVPTCFPFAITEADLEGKTGAAIVEMLEARIRESYKAKEAVEEPETLKHVERYVVISAIDKLWQTHLTEMESLRQESGLAAYGQKDPLQEYKREAFNYFGQLMQNIRGEVCSGMFRAASNLGAFERMLAMLTPGARLVGPSEDGSSEQAQAAVSAAPTADAAASGMPVVGRNDPCPCGSGLKYKKCCGITRMGN